jgi:glycosyltransferase involved in cell wall biosynthesis
MMNKKISIITINYNNLEGLRRTVESVINQTWQEFEYIVIDGASNDGSADYVESQSENIDYWVSEPDSGIYQAMNKGIAKATGEYLLFLNSGDHFNTTTILAENHHHLKDFDLIYFDIIHIGSTFSKVVSYPGKLVFSDLVFDTLPHQSTFIKKSMFDDFGLYDESLKIVADWKFFILAIFKYHCSYYKVNTPLVVFYLDGLSYTIDYSEESNRMLQSNFPAFYEDYQELKKLRIINEQNQKIVSSNRFQMLLEMEKTMFGKKLASVFFRIYIIVFSKKKLASILKKNK